MGGNDKWLKSESKITSLWTVLLEDLKKQCARAGVIAEVRKREAYEKPSVKRKKRNPRLLANVNLSKQMNENGKAGNYARFFDYLQHFKRRFDNGSITPLHWQ